MNLFCEKCDPKDHEGFQCRCEARNMLLTKMLRDNGYSKWAQESNLTHDQLVSRIQSFYMHLKKDYEGLRVAREYPCDDKHKQRKIEEEYHKSADLFEAFSHVFENVIYPWLD